uniref:Secreted protein n=1 Tax=Trichuris muris TaxID=70415 RepID=A0A5S6Q6C7_TRIMR
MWSRILLATLDWKLRSRLAKGNSSQARVDPSGLLLTHWRPFASLPLLRRSDDGPRGGQFGPSAKALVRVSHQETRCFFVPEGSLDFLSSQLRKLSVRLV